MDREQALRAVGEHVPEPRRRGHPARCAECDERYPCPELRAALDELTGHDPGWQWT